MRELPPASAMFADRTPDPLAKSSPQFGHTTLWFSNG